MSTQREFTYVLEETSDTIDALHASRRTNVQLKDLPDAYLEALRFDLNLLSQVLEREVADRRERRGVSNLDGGVQ